ncbi:EamA family transporter [Tabrizicola sp.]|uniref:EamA family transporter n=1 Tax=Tabrizicola sp. TaxID=2005166 RepID=UPI003F3C526B
MTAGVFLAVLAAAFIHALWNALIKTGASKQSAMLILGVSQALSGACIAFWKGVPADAAWPWLVASGVIHMCYQLNLGYAYEHGDLSRVYPISRGTAPMIVLIVSSIFLADVLTDMEVAGVVVLGFGILMMVRGVFTGGESRKMLPFALGAAAATAGYSITDGMGARAAGDAVLYVGWLMMIAAVFYIPAAVAQKGTVLFRAPPKAWAMGTLAGALSCAGYAIAVWAMTVAPIALVAALRETSILFAVLIGWLVFGEKMTPGKALAATVIVAGVMLTRL